MGKIMFSKAMNRQPALDILRFSAAIMVATFHWGLELGDSKYHVIYDITLFGNIIKYGSFGVDIFFIISGYVIFASAQKYNFFYFLFARFVRLFPGLLISMLIVLVVGSRFINTYPYPFSSFINSIFLTYEISGHQPLVTVLWTLIIEIKFYLGVAILVLFLPKMLKSAIGSLTILFFWELIVVFLNYFHFSYSDYLLQFFGLNGYKNLFVLGICCYLLSQIDLRLNLENIFAILFFIYSVYQVIAYFKYPYEFRFYLLFVVVLILFSKFLIFPPFMSKLAFFLGWSSYLIYLLHEHLGMTIILQIRSRLTDNIIIMVFGTIVLITFFCILLAFFVERPLQRILKRNFRKMDRVTTPIEQISD